MEALRVSCAVIVQGPRFLLARRPLHKSQGGSWEFPGGKIDATESPEQCIVREIMEELSLSVAVMRRLPTVTHDYPDKRILLIPLLCEIRDGSLVLTEHIEARWVTLTEAALLDLCEADKKLLPLLAGELP